MPNSIATRQNASYVAGAAEANAPILKLTSHQMDKQFGEDSGDVVNVKLQNYGVVTKGEAIGNTDVIVDTVPIKVEVYNTAASLGIVEESLKVGNFKEVVAKPRGAKLANTIQKEVFEAGLLGASMAQVHATGNFAQLSTAITGVQSSEMSGEISGMLSYGLYNLINNSGISQFGNSDLAKQLYRGVIGNYNGVDFISGASNLIHAPALLFSAAATATAAAAPAEVDLGGGNVQLVTALTASAVQTLTKGTLWRLAGVKCVDEFGNETQEDFTFVVQAAVAASATVYVQPIYFAGPRKNVSVASITDLAISSPMTASKTYVTGLVFCKNDILTAAKPIAEFPGGESVSLTDVASLPLRMTAQGNISSGARTTRWDFLFGKKVKTGRATCGLYVPIN